MSIRDLDDGVKERLQLRAARNGRSMEAEIRSILTDAVDGPDRSRGLFGTLLERMQEVGGVDLEPPARNERPRDADFG